MPAEGLAKTYKLENEHLRVEVATRTFSVNVVDKDTGQRWSMVDEPFDEVVLERDGKVSKETLAKASHVRARELGGKGVLFEFADYRLNLLLMIEGGSLTFELIPLEENERFKIKGASYPRPFRLSAAGSASFVASFSQGLMIPGNWPEEVRQFGDLYQFNDEKRMRTFGELFHMDVNWWSSYRPGYAPALECQLLMPWWAAVERKGSVLIVLDEASWANSYLLVRHPAGGPTTWRLLWLPCRGEMRYPRRLTYTFMKGDYVALAKRYRRIAEERGKCVTLREKQQCNPKMSKLVGAPFLGVAFLRHDYRRYDHAVLITFAEAAERIEAFRAATGLAKLHVHARCWQQRGHDIQYPDLVPPAPDAGGPAGFDDLSTRVQKLGYAFGLGGDNYHDVALDSALFDESMLLRYADGSTNRRNLWASGLTSLICHAVALKYLRRNFEVGRTDYPSTKGLLETAHPDTYWIGNYISSYECYDPRHPMTRSTCWDAQREIFQYINDRGLLLNNEHPMDWACPYFYAARTSQARQAVYGYDRAGTVPVGLPVPLWSLVYHDCCITGGDDVLLQILNGSPPHVSLDDAGNPSRISRVRLHAKLHERVFFDEMTAHEFLTPDGRVQRTEFSGRAAVTIDEKRNTFKVTGVKGVEAKEFELDEKGGI